MYKKIVNKLDESYRKLMLRLSLPSFLFVILVLIIVAGLMQYWFANYSQNTIHEVGIQKKIETLQTELDKHVFDLSLKVKQNPEVIWRYQIPDNEFDPSFYLFLDTLPVAWNSQLIPININLIHSNSSLHKLPNGWYLLSKFKVGSYQLVGLTKIKTAYAYENKYLSNLYHPYLNISNQVEITIDKLPGWKHIHNKKGQYLFSLKANSSGLQFNSISLIGMVSIILSLLLVILLIARHVYRYFKTGKGAAKASILFILFILLYYLFFITDWFSILYSSSLFSPVYFAASRYVSSLGTLLLLVLIFFASSISANYAGFGVIKQRITQSHPVVRIVLVYLVFKVILFVLFIIVEHSSGFDLFINISALSSISMVRFSLFFFLIFGFVFLADLFLIFKRIHIKYSSIIVVVFSVFVIEILHVIIFKHEFNFVNLLFFVLIAAFLIVRNSRKQKNLFNSSIRHIFFLVLIISCFSVYLLFHFNQEKEKSNRLFLVETLANNLAGEQDAVAEMFLSNSDVKIQNDLNIIDMLANESLPTDELATYLKNNYFYGYLNRFDLQVIICWPKANLLVEGVDQTYDCYDYFNSIIANSGSQIVKNSSFYFLNKDNGRVNYFGVFRYRHPTLNKETTIFIDLISKPYFEGLGYPELLVTDKGRSKLGIYEDYSYGKYIDGHLVKRSGAFLYRIAHLNNTHSQEASSDKYFFNDKEFSHLCYEPKGKNESVVISLPKITFQSVLTGFSIVFLLFLLLSFSIFGLFIFYARENPHRFTIRERIQYTMVAFMVILMLVIGTSSIIYATHQFRQKNKEMLSQRLKSIMHELDQKIGSEETLNANIEEYLSYLLQNFSNVFYTDINLYGLDGSLLATSRKELYDDGIVGTLMNPEAFVSLKINGDREYIHNESIGRLNYISAYVPFLNQKNEVLAYLNIPYFVSDDELKEDISSIVVTIMNAYLIFLLMAIGMAVIASRQITRPLMILQQRLSQTRLGLKNEKISYQRNDEIGRLVDEYNRMVDELASSADLLAKSERESAWREMAKQIAHEIKNPLTPMKLSIQYLQKAWDDKVDDFDSYIQRVTNTLVDQINQLSVIATEFSNFAKMPAANRQETDILSKLIRTVELFKKSSPVKISLDVKDFSAIVVNTDPEQILSVFNNLIKNAIQSIPTNQSGLVSVGVNVVEDDVIITFKDNGKGISPEVVEKLFTPNFTTKTSGMGLGLAIARNIVEASDGKIWFETQVGSGSVFYVSFPVVSFSS